ncbi:MAG TPA: TonB-dependent receptor [Terriglobales bacterium]|nr:TonB-dependent receptor [Terriglobales bacterium]
MRGFIRAAACADIADHFQAIGQRNSISHNADIPLCRHLRLWLIVAAVLPTVAAALQPQAAPVAKTVAMPASSAATTQAAVPDASRSTPLSQETTKLGEIVVTAEHVRSTVAKTPISMSVISGDQLTRQGLTTVADLNGYAQNLNVQENYNGVQFTIRGVTNSNGSTLNDPAVAFMLNGIYIARQTTPMYMGFYDIDRIEVLRGPQGTLWGRNTIGGVVNVITNTPDPTSFRYSGSASAGNYGATNDQFMVNVPVTGNFAVRAAVLYDRRNTYLNKTPGDPYSLNPAKGDFSGRVSLLWNVNDNMTLQVVTDYANMDNVFFEWVPVTNFYRQPTTANPVYNEQNPLYYDRGTTEQLSANGFRQYRQGGTSAHTWGISPQLDWNLGHYLKMTYLSAYRAQDEYYQYEFPVTTTYTMPNTYVSSDEEDSQELRFAIQGVNNLQAQFGLYYFREALYDNWSIYDSPDVLNYGYLDVTNDPQINKSYAAFGQATYHVMRNLRLIAGLRESHLKKTYFSEETTNSRPYSDPATDVATPSFSTAAASKFTWRTGIEYDLARGTMLYGTVSTGFKAGGVNYFGCLLGTSRNGVLCTANLALPASVLLYKPETLTSYEAGIKSRFADDSVYVTLDGFHYNYDNLQVETLQKVAGIEIEATTNAAQASLNGVEFSGIWKPNEKNKFSLGLTYLDSQYGNYFPLGQGTQPNYKGRPLDDSPQYTLNVGYTYTQPLSFGGSLEMTVNGYLSDSYVVSDVAIPVQYRQPAYHMTDLNATYNFPNGNWYVAAYARNLENKILVINATPTAVVPGDPRTFGFRVGFYY